MGNDMYIRNRKRLSYKPYEYGKNKKSYKTPFNKERMEEHFFHKTASEIVTNRKMQSTKKCIQHGNVSVYGHCAAVAAYSIRLAEKLGIKYDKRSLIRGALLHDFFLYDWHKTSNVGDGLHGFAHPLTASKNAIRDFRLNKRELDIIRTHMWPLTLRKLPKHRESWLVCLVDKYCSVLETLKINKYDDDSFIREELLAVIAEEEKRRILKAREAKRRKMASLSRSEAVKYPAGRKSFTKNNK